MTGLAWGSREKRHGLGPDRRGGRWVNLVPPARQRGPERQDQLDSLPRIIERSPELLTQGVHPAVQCLRMEVHASGQLVHRRPGLQPREQQLGQVETAFGCQHGQ